MKTVWFLTRKQFALTPFLVSALAIFAPSLWWAVNAEHAYQAGVPGTYELSFLPTANS